MTDSNSVLQFWLTQPKKWFPPKDKRPEVDKEIATLFLPVLQSAIVDNLQTWKSNPKSFVALIIILDQFSRHISRHLNNNVVDVTLCTKMAEKYSKEIINKKWYLSYNCKEFVFFLMPLRHIQSEENYLIIFTLTDERKLTITSDSALLNKFHNTSIAKHEHFKYDNQHEKKSSFSDVEILEHYPFRADENTLTSHRIYISMNNFLGLYKPKQDKYVVVSLSGGVDSMVIAKNMNVLQTKYNYQTVAIHINYNNRSESTAEASFLKKWCADNNILFVLFEITNIKRGVTPRDVYERQSRKMRFDIYKKVLLDYNCTGIYVGHHRGDIQENVISNIMKGNTILNLAGMAKATSIDNVDIMRPLLDDDKSYIYDFAHKYGIPYFKDSTPEWSNRGKIRNKLIPLLQDIYGKGVMNTLSKVALESQQTNEIVQTIMEPLLKSITEYKLGIGFDCSLCHKKYHDKENIYKTIINEMFYRLGFRSTNIKTIRIFMAQLDKKNGWITFSNKSHAILYNKKLFILKNNTFIKDKIIIKNCGSGDHKIGNYNINISQVDTINIPISQIQMHTLLSGDFNYDICTDCSINIETGRNMKLFGCTDITAKGFPIIVKNPKNKLSKKIFYRITYKISV